jgi:DNA-binding NarL/FixJ family response regulator
VTDSRSIRVLVVDDQAMVRAGIPDDPRDRTAHQRRCEAADGLDALEMVERARPDVVLMDVGCRGWTASRQPRGSRRCRRQSAPPPRVLILTTFDLDDHVYAACARGRAASC